MTSSSPLHLKTLNKLVIGREKLVTKRDTGDRGVPAQLGMGVSVPSTHVVPASDEPVSGF